MSSGPHSVVIDACVDPWSAVTLVDPPAWVAVLSEIADLCGGLCSCGSGAEETPEVGADDDGLRGLVICANAVIVVRTSLARLALWVEVHSRVPVDEPSVRAVLGRHGLCVVGAQPSM